MHKEIILPAQFADAPMDWARDRANLWNSVELGEARKNARVAREYLVVLPFELTPRQRLDLARGFSQELSDRYRFAVDLAIHAPRDFPGSDPRNFHAHLLATTREVGAEGLGARTALELGDDRRAARGLGPAIYELLWVRERWANVTNAAFRDANIEARVDHRSLEAQGIEREPILHIPRIPYELERRGYRSFVAERVRAEHQARVQSRLERSIAQEAAKEPTVGSAAVQPSKAAARVQSLDEIRREARETWRQMRGETAGSSAGEDRGLNRDDDLAR
jgi:ATP-dependent exoDNAse (exonuclease V) alpha subunit